AMAVIESNPHRTHKELFTDKGSGNKIVLQETFNAREEGGWIVNKIAEMLVRKEAGPGDFAIMYRTNAQSRLIEEAFLQMNMAYKLVGAQRFYGRREVKLPGQFRSSAAPLAGSPARTKPAGPARSDHHRD
ncbi:MAG: 3'-5' exonuclease, partial [Anaerolineales bacterium]